MITSVTAQKLGRNLDAVPNISYNSGSYELSPMGRWDMLDDNGSNINRDYSYYRAGWFIGNCSVSARCSECICLSTPIFLLFIISASPYNGSAYDRLELTTLEIKSRRFGFGPPIFCSVLANIVPVLYGFVGAHCTCDSTFSLWSVITP